MTSCSALLLTLTWAAESEAADPPALQAIGPLRAAVADGTCLDLHQGSTANLTNVQLWECKDAAFQTWYMTMTGELRSAANPGMCLETWDGNVWLAHCNGESWQRWRLTDAGEVRSVWNADRCLDVAGGSGLWGTNIRLWSCNGTDAQRFSIARLPWAEVHSAVHDNRCLDVYGGSTQVGADVIIWECTGNDNQAWYLSAAGELRSGVAANRCLDVSGPAAAGVDLQSWECNGTDAQRFFLGTDQQIHLASAPEYCVDVQGGSTAYGTPVQLWPCNGTDAQRWASTSFASVELVTIGETLALSWTTEAGGYALSDPGALLKFLARMGADDTDLAEAFGAMSEDQQAFVLDALGPNQSLADYAGQWFAPGDQPRVHATEWYGGELGFSMTEDALNVSMWGANVAVGIDEYMAVLTVGLDSVRMTTQAGVVSLDQMLETPANAFFGYDLDSDTVQISVQLLVFQVDLYITGLDLDATWAEVESVSQQAVAWTDQAIVDTGTWFVYAASDTAQWVTGATETINDAAEDVFDALFGWL